MCGRVKLEGDFSQLKTTFHIPDDYPAPNYAPSWNVAPTDSLPIVRYNAKESHRALDPMRWGLVPYWAKDLKIGFSTINAMAETVDTKPVFREAFRLRRCLVRIEAFHEWKKLDDKNKQPYAIALAAGGLMALAGLWEGRTGRTRTAASGCGASPSSPRRRTSCAPRSTTACRSSCRRLNGPLWLGEDPAGAEELKAVLRPYPAEDMTTWPVSPRVGNVRNNDPSLIEPIEVV
jgi:putative SOS response-associated peptidase YedK